jgi:ATP-dependent DNA ligase
VCGTLIVAAKGALEVKYCLIDGEVGCWDENGVPVFKKLQRAREQVSRRLRRTARSRRVGARMQVTCEVAGA